MKQWERLFLVLIGLTAALTSFVDAQGTRVDPFPLIVSNPVHCDDIVKNSLFDGDCCALDVGDKGDVCVLTVINGRCIVSILWRVENRIFVSGHVWL
jgi:hypothetical protein